MRIVSNNIEKKKVNSMVDLDKSISVVRKTGKTTLGVKQAIKSAKLGDAQVIVIAANAPKEYKEDIEYYAKLSETPIIYYPRTSYDLGVVIGRPHLTAFITVYDSGDSDILEAIEA